MGTRRRVQQRHTDSSRRSFLSWLWWGLGALACVEFVGLTAAYLWPRKPRGVEAGSVVEAGSAEAFPPGSVTAFPDGRFYLARLEDGSFLALSRTCTHLGCTVPWNEKKKRFECPCHASTFDITGSVLDPPAPRALNLFAVRITEGVVVVDTGTRMRRQRFEASQAVHL